MANVEVVYPEFNSNDIHRHYERTGFTPTDFNDLFILQRIDRIEFMIIKCLLSLEQQPHTSFSRNINI